LIVGISLVPVEKTLANQRLGAGLNEPERRLKQAQNGHRTLQTQSQRWVDSALAMACDSRKAFHCMCAGEFAQGAEGQSLRGGSSQGQRRPILGVLPLT
jgi:hypothetical protein